jgi:hypothetical protein
LRYNHEEYTLRTGKSGGIQRKIFLWGVISVQKERIRNIQVFNQEGEMILDCKKNYHFPVKYVNKKPIDNILLIKGRGLPDLYEGEGVDVVIHTVSGESVKYFCKVESSGSHKLTVSLNAERARQFENKRRYYRIKTAINCRICDVTRGMNVTAYNPNLYGKIHDINIGGVMIEVESEDSYREEDIITFTAVLGDSKLEISGRVLHQQASEDQSVTGYRCSFVAPTAYQEEIISSYINHIQIEERRVEMEKAKIEAEISSGSSAQQ